MALYVNTNVSSLNAQRKLSNSTINLNTNYQRLASGLRINSAKDDAAGLLISNRLTSQINGLNQGNRNANDGIALAQTVEGALDETSNMLQRIRTLAVQASNGTNTQEDRNAIQKEIDSLSQEISRIARKTTYAGVQVLDGTPATDKNGAVLDNTLLDAKGKLTFQLGSNHHDTITLDLSSGFTISAIGTAVKDLDNGNNSAQFQFPNNPSLAGLVSRDHVDDIDGDTKVEGEYMTWSVSSQSVAQATLENIDKFINYVDGKRADLGAIQNRMESTIRNQSSIAENESDARSRIRDTDFAAETASLTANQILQQASQTVLMQANQRPTVALNLLG